MDEDILKPLLETELRAQELVDAAFKERDRLVEQAQQEARVAEQRFAARVPEIYASFVGRAEERAAQTLAELERRYEERSAELRLMAEERREQAIEEAIEIVLDPARI